jgi:hypothetical protein
MAHRGSWGNRWYHAVLQLVVFGTGKAAAILTFAQVDGDSIMRSTAELQKRGPLNR